MSDCGDCSSEEVCNSRHQWIVDKLDNHELMLTDMAKKDKYHDDHIEKNNARIDAIDKKIDVLIDTTTPLLSGIHSLQESVKVLTYLSKAAQWIGKFIVVPIIGFIAGYEAFTHFIKKL